MAKLAYSGAKREVLDFLCFSLSKFDNMGFIRYYQDSSGVKSLFVLIRWFLGRTDFHHAFYLQVDPKQ